MHLKCLRIAGLKAALGFLPGNGQSTQESESHCFVYTVSMLDLVQKQTAYWAHFECASLCTHAHLYVKKVAYYIT